MAKLLMTTDAIGGVWQYSLELAAGLGAHGFHILLAVMGGGMNAARRAEVQALPHVELVENDCKLEWMDDPWQDVKESGAWLLRLERTFQPHVVHLNGYAQGALPWRAPVIVAGHSCVLSWRRAVLGADEEKSLYAYREAVRRGLQAADLVVAPSGSMLDALEFHYGPLRRTRVIANGRRAGGFPAGRKENVILSAGRVWDAAKNIEILGDASQTCSWPIYIAGDAVRPGGGQRELARVTLLGKLDTGTLAAWYSRTAIYAAPALYEPFGLSVLEAALARCALVLSDIPSFREIWGDAAVYVNPRDAAAWGQQLNALMSNPERREELAAAAQARAFSFTAGKMTGEYLQAYRQAHLHRTCVSLSSATPFDPTGIMETPIFSGV